MRVFAYKNDHQQQYANVELRNGDRLHVRVGFDKAEIVKLRLGRIPLGVVWAATGPKQMGRLIYDSQMPNRLDSILKYLRGCSCIADIPARLPNFADS